MIHTKTKEDAFASSLRCGRYLRCGFVLFRNNMYLTEFQQDTPLFISPCFATIHGNPCEISCEICKSQNKIVSLRKLLCIYE